VRGSKRKIKPPRLTCHDLSRPVPSPDPNLAASTVLLLPPPPVPPRLLLTRRLLLLPRLSLPAAPPRPAVCRATPAAPPSLDDGIGCGTSVVKRRRRRRGRVALVNTTPTVHAVRFFCFFCVCLPVANRTANLGTSPDLDRLIETRVSTTV
jgi:hypothetical protein